MCCYLPTYFQVQSWLSPVLFFRWPVPENYISHAPLLGGLQLGSANEGLGKRLEGRETGIEPGYSSPSLFLAPGSISAIAVPPSWIQFPLPGPTVVPASIERPQLQGSGPRGGSTFLHLLNSESPHFFPRLLCHHPNTSVTVPVSSSASCVTWYRAYFPVGVRLMSMPPVPGQAKPVLERVGTNSRESQFCVEGSRAQKERNG